MALKLPSDDRFHAALALSGSLVATKLFPEAISFLAAQMPKAQRAFGAEHDIVMRLRWSYGDVLHQDIGTSRDDVVEATTLLEELFSTARRIYGPAHPVTAGIQVSCGTRDVADFAHDAACATSRNTMRERATATTFAA